MLTAFLSFIILVQVYFLLVTLLSLQRESREKNKRSLAIFFKDFDLSSLRSAKSLILPDSIESLDLSSLTSAKGLAIPDGIESYPNITSIKGMTLPNKVEDYFRALSELRAADVKFLKNNSVWKQIGKGIHD